MQIKQIELKGFKSFKQKTVIRFDDGINCIVGPNGCGKSNILDAFMWVMGEIAPSHLRGSSMEDLIFTGTDQQPQAGLAEVSLVLEKTKHRSLPSPYRNFSEIMLTRRLDRDGKSEYLLNSKVCRLKDIQDVFMDTGSGVHGFSFIEQGAVENFISSKPEQKRRLIETAAGISRFRIKKKEAERKLSLTAANLQRLEDLLGDQENQLKKLKKQSEKSEQFRTLKKAIQEKDLQISHWDMALYENENKKLNQNLKEERKKADQTKSHLTELNSTLERLKKDYESKKQELQSAEEELTICRQETQTLEKALAGLSSSLQARSDNKTSDQEDAESSQQNKSKTLQLLSENKKTLEKIEQHRLKLLEQQDHLKKECLRQEQHCYSLELKSKSMETRLLDFKQRETLTGELSKSVERSISELIQSEKEYNELLDKKYREQQKLQSKKVKLQEQLEKEKQLSFNVSQQVEQLKEELEQLKKNIAKKETDFQETTVISKKELQEIKQIDGFKYFLKDRLEENKQLVEWLFTRTAVVNNLTVAMKLKTKYPLWCFISLDGEVITSEGDVVTIQDKASINISEYKRAMEKIPVQYQSWKEKKSMLNRELKDMKNAFQQKTNELARLSKKEGGGEVFVFGIKKDLELVSRDLIRMDSEVLELQQKIQSCQKKLQESKDKQKTMEGPMDSMQFDNLEQELERITKERDEERGKKEALLNEKKQIDQKISDYEIERQSIKVKQDLLYQSVEQEKQREQSLFVRSQEKQKQIEKEQEEISLKELHLKQSLEKMDKQTTDVKLLTETCESTQKEVDQKQTDIIKLHETLSEMESNINEIQLEQEGINSKKSSLLARVEELYQIKLDSKNYKGETVFDREKAEEELQQMNARLSRMGAVNLLALEEQEDLSKENQFYQEQYEDLLSSREKLQQAIDKIDRFCSEKFKAVFEQVNTCFSKIFPTLFEGGKAELMLIELDGGEEGIDIMVQPPGKKVQNMNLLSGGEKAMTAVSVIFSIFMVKPSPFCILDEVDAPLDDVNIARFNSLLTEMSNISQVIIITHNKYTMKNSGRLYGVTMEEKGISKVMSLDMKSMAKSTSSQHSETL